MNEVEPAWVDEVLRFWFEDLSPADWFNGGPALDARIGERFLLMHEALAANDGAALHHVHGPRPTLAAVLVLDQFSRHLFRGDRRAYASDSLARRLAAAALAHGWDRELGRAQRLFLSLPFQHSEDRADQARAVELAEAIGDEEWIVYARAHQVLIERFGRFPHRNTVLGRESTAEELEALRQPMGSF
jgi:uncharacterized protein (DUF924 family)